MIVRRVSIAALLAPLLFLSAGVEASPLCDRLFARLADLPQTVSTETPPRDFSGAISRRNIDLRRARSEQRELGCSSGSITVINGDNEDACAAIDDRIAGIRDDLEELKARRTEDIGGAEDGAARRRVMIAIQANRCEEIDGDLVSASVSPESDPLEGGHRNIIANLPPIGEEMSLRGPSDPPSDLSAPDLHLLSQDGPLRTMCVRTCDGAFFPISADATSRDFDRDAAACTARCPGAQTELYYHALAEETETMISASTGRPYIELPTAFAYKTGDAGTRSQCGCRLPPVPASTPAMLAPPARMSTSVVTITTTRGPPKTDLPSIAPATAQSVTTPAKPMVERPYDPKANRVRQVGPSFLPAEESAIDLQHPAGPGYQQQQQTN